MNRFFILLILINLLGCGKKEIVKKYYDNGNVKAEVEVVDGKKNGRQVKYYENGDTMSISYWENGKENGVKIEKYKNGNIQYITHWKDDTQDGLMESFYKNGKIKSTSYWKNNEQHGEGRIFYENGQLSEIYNRKNGILDGPFKWYYENGTLQAEGLFRDSAKVGVVKEYYETGKLKAEKHFVNFKGIQTYTGGIEYNEDGSIKEETIRVDIKTEQDTINLNEELKLIITLKKPYFDKTKVTIGNYDDKFLKVDSTTLVTLEAANNNVFYKFKAKEKGLNYVRGFVTNYMNMDKKGKVTKESYTYFEFPYYVK